MGHGIANAERRVDLDTTTSAMALTVKEMNSKYKETSEGGLAVSVVLCERNNMQYVHSPQRRGPICRTCRR